MPTTLESDETIKHDGDKRKHISTAIHRFVIRKQQEAPRTVKNPRNTNLDPQLVWRGKHRIIVYMLEEQRMKPRARASKCHY